MRLVLLAAITLITVAFQACTPSADSPPSSGDLSFRKINTSGWSDSPYITRDGQRLYFMYSRYNFFPIFTGGSPLLQGPSRPGHHNNDINPFEDSDIYVSTRNADGTWGTPRNLSFNTSKAECCMMIVDGPPLTIVYQTSSATQGNELVYRVENSDGTWGAETSFGATVNSTADDDNPHMSQDGLGLWFTSNRAGGSGGRDLWFSAKVAGTWQAPVNLGAPVNSAADEDQFWLDTAGTTAYFNRDSTIYKTTWNGSAFSAPTAVNLSVSFAAEASMPDSGAELFFAAGDPASQRLIIYRAVKNPDGTFQPAVPLD